MPMPERFAARDGALLVVDVQERLIPAILDRDRLVANAIRLALAARMLDVPSFATEQYPQGLGPTVPELAGLFAERPAKLTFHACGAPGLVDHLGGAGIRHVTVTGIESHICVAQTAVELLRLGYRVQVPVDAVGSRFRLDHDVALRRLERAGAVLTTTEAALFEWAETAAHPLFKRIAALVKDRPPDTPA
ncbi:hydrolase [Tundrisphaera sp. TA3]|uniref:hydrolase n=1 Tax=Tundrisphaera sp. TA3 TaxID=3435775 RepID=UPI003EBD14A7